MWLGRFRHQPLNTPPTFSGGGVAAEDINGDGHFDLLFVGGIGNALLINDGHGRFTDITEQAGIALLRPDGTHGEARKPIIADFDNDGRQDILITYANDDHRLYRKHAPRAKKARTVEKTAKELFGKADSVVHGRIECTRGAP